MPVLALNPVDQQTDQLSHPENCFYQKFSVMPQVAQQPVTEAVVFLNDGQRQFFAA